MKPKSLETTVGVASVILALSPFSDSFKTIVVSKAFQINITVFHLYLGYALFFALFVLAQLYWETLLSTATNQSKRTRFRQVLRFAYYVLLSFPPLVLLNLVLAEFFAAGRPPDDRLSFRNPAFVLLFILWFVWLYRIEYQTKFKNSGHEIELKDRLQNDLRLADLLIEKDRWIEAGLLHYEISMIFLSLLIPRGEGSITDRATNALLKQKISTSQREAFQEIASTWDYCRLTEERDNAVVPREKSRAILRNNIFLQSTVEPQCQ